MTVMMMVMTAAAMFVMLVFVVMVVMVMIAAAVFVMLVFVIMVVMVMTAAAVLVMLVVMFMFVVMMSAAAVLVMLVVMIMTVLLLCLLQELLFDILAALFHYFKELVGAKLSNRRCDNRNARIVLSYKRNSLVHLFLCGFRQIGSRKYYCSC